MLKTSGGSHRFFYILNSKSCSKGQDIIVVSYVNVPCVSTIVPFFSTIVPFVSTVVPFVSTVVALCSDISDKTSV